MTNPLFDMMTARMKAGEASMMASLRIERMQTERSPSIQQRDSMMKDMLALETLMHYCRLVVEEEVVNLTISPHDYGNYARLITNEERVLRFEELFMFEHIVDKFLTGLGDEESLREIRMKINALVYKLRPMILNHVQLSCHWDFKQNEISILSKADDTYQGGGQIVLDFESIHGNIISRASTGQGCMILYLYLLDLMEFLTVQRSPGEKMVRILPIYPTKQFNVQILSTYNNHLKVMRLMMLDGIELADITREAMRDYANKLVK